MKTLPAALLRHSAVIHIPENVNAWQKISSAASLTLSRIYVQRTEGVRISAQDSDVQLHAEFWYDCRLSRPAGLDFIALFRQAQAAGTTVRCSIGGAEYRMILAECLNDAHGKPHHYHLQLE